MHSEIIKYNHNQEPPYKEICNLLANEIDRILPDAENKVWHSHPVWFLDGNPIVGYSKQKSGIQLMFWSGVDFEESELNIVGKKFKDASVFFNDATKINLSNLQRWLYLAIFVNLIS